MMYNIVFIGIAYLFTVVALRAQEAIDIDGHADCITALDIKVQKVFGPTTAPKGAGKLLEFKHKRVKSSYLVDKEKNSVWYTFKAQTNAELTFSIVPLSIKDDYDFALYEYTDSNFCKEVELNEQEPIRTNFSRNNPKIKSTTGLAVEAPRSFVMAGVNMEFSKSVATQKGKRYYLVLNNVYEKGRGHALYFDYQRSIKVSVKVLSQADKTPLIRTVQLIDGKTQRVLKKISTEADGQAAWESGISLSNFKHPLLLKVQDPIHGNRTIQTTAKELLQRKGLPFVFDIGGAPLTDELPTIVPIHIAGKVSIENSKKHDAEVLLTEYKSGRLLAKGKSDILTGAYSLLVSQSTRKDIRLQIYKKGYVFADTVLSSKALRINNTKGIKLNYKLDTIVKNKIFNLGNILFKGGMAVLVPGCEASLKLLLRMMQDNPKLQILVEGHTNGCPYGEASSMKLSKDRCLKVCDYLVKNGIKGQRLSFKGYGCSNLLYPVGGKKEFLNRRIEVVVLDH